MKGKSLIILIAAIAVAGIAAWWFLRPASPSGKSSISHDGLDVSVKYSRPYKKGRIIFGDAASGALQPNGEYWRLGANAATEITFSRDVAFGGETVKAGTYRMYAIPDSGTWQVVLNSALGKSGSELPDKNFDVVSISVPVTEATAPLEQFTIEFRPAATGVIMELKWDRVIAPVEIS